MKVLQNDFSPSFMVAVRGEAGVYFLGMPSKFTVDKTFLNIGNASPNPSYQLPGVLNIPTIEWQDTSNIIVRTFALDLHNQAPASGEFADNILTDTPVEIIVYP
jgi:hypothetical protein